MIKKFNNFGKINEDKTLDDYYDTFEFEDGAFLETIERGQVSIRMGDKVYNFHIELGEGFADVILDNDTDKKELEELGITFSTKPKYEMWVDDSEFEDFMHDMYKESIN